MNFTIRDIAKGCNVSIATVSRAINGTGYVKKELKTKILDYANEQGWRTSYVAQCLKKGENRAVALLANSLIHMPNSTSLQLIIMKLREKGYHTAIGVGKDADFYKKELSMCLERQLAAVLAITPPPETAQEIKLLRNSGIRTLTLFSHFKSEDSLGINPDFELYGHLAMKHLLDMGHRHIAFFAYLGEHRKVKTLKDFNTLSPNHCLTIKGIMRAAKKAGVDFDLNRNLISDNFGDLSRFKDALFNGRHTAYICQKAELLTSFYSICNKEKIKIPNDVSVVGLQGNKAFEAYSPVPVYLDYDYEEIAEMATKAITDEQFDPSREILTRPFFHEGESVKKIKDISKNKSKGK